VSRDPVLDVWRVEYDAKLTMFRFCYTEERKPDGSPKYRVDSEAHAELY
jgi:hypothetical protein